MSNKLLTIGLDGATFRVIKPLVQEGRLPNLERLLRGGVHGILQSTPDTNSPCAWSTFITGKNAGRHGIFGFFENMPNSYRVRFLNGSFRSGKSLWKILSENGKRVGVINVPFSYPVEEVNGFIIGGPDSPSKTAEQFAFPAHIMGEVERKAGSYIIEAGASALVRQGRKTEAIAKLQECIECRLRTAKYLIEKEDYDFFMVVFTESDRIQHHFWKYINPVHPAYNSPERAEFGGAIFDIYERLDSAIGELVEAAGDDYAVLIMSDHGAGPASNKTFFVNRWLESAGHLTFKKSRSMKARVRTLGERIVGDSYILINSRFSRRSKRILRNLFPNLKNRANSILRGLKIEWENTKAFSWENAPTIYINLKGKFPWGNVEPGLEYEALRDQLTEELLNLRSPEDGEPMVERVARKEELYHGPFMDKAPDLFVEWKDDQYTVRPGYASRGGSFIEVITGDRLAEVETISRASGVHKPDGVFVFCGGQAKEDMEITPLNLDDVTATILYYLGVAVPEDFDGRVVTDVFSDQFVREHSILFSETSTEKESFDLGYSEDEAEIIEERLQGLGYID